MTKPQASFFRSENIVLDVSALFEIIWAVIFLFFPQVIQSMVKAPLPFPLIRVVSAAPFAVGVLSFLLTKLKADHDPMPFLVGLTTLATFHGLLTVTLFLAWQAQLVPWFGWVVHLPFFIYFTYASARWISSS